MTLEEQGSRPGEAGRGANGGGGEDVVDGGGEDVAETTVGLGIFYLSA
jgi:hypothetical protein